MHLYWALATAAALCTVRAQSTDTSSTENPLAAYPSCAQTCIMGAFTNTTFCPDPTNTTCTCTSQGFSDFVEACVLSSCSLREALATENATETMCGVPIADNSPQLVREIWTMMSIAIAVIVIRVVFNAFFTEAGLWWDDYSIILLLLFGGIPAMVLQCVVLAPAGVGRDMWTLPFENIDTIFKYSYIISVLYLPQVALLKLTFLFFFMRIFPSQGVRRVIQGTIIFSLIYGLAYLLVNIFACTPISYYWVWDGSPGGYCIDRNAIQWGSAIISIVLDLWMLAIPLWNIRSLQMHWKQKIAVSSMFLVGALVTVICCIRLKYLNDFFNSNNPTRGLFDTLRWSTIEGFTSSVCACMPAFRSIYLRFFSSRSKLGSKAGYSSDITSYGERSRTTKQHYSAWSRANRGHSNSVIHDDSEPINSSSEYELAGGSVQTGSIMQSKTFVVDYTQDTNRKGAANLEAGNSGSRW